MSKELIERIDVWMNDGETGFYATVAIIQDCRDELTKQADQIETLRMQLAACDVAALQNTRESLETRIPKDNPYYSAAYRSVCDAVDREIAHREGCTKQAERVKALEEYRNTNEDLIGTLLDSLEKIESHFSDKGELEGEGKWRLDSIYKAVQQANEAVDKCVAARKQSKLAAATKLIAKWSVQIDDKNNGRHTAAWAQLRICRDELAAVLKEGERKPSIDVIAEMAKHEDGGISVGGLMGDQCGVCGIGFCLPSGRCDHCNAVLRKGET